MSVIQVLSSLATKEAYLELVPRFEQSTGHRIATTWAGTVDIMTRMAAGEVYDLLIASRSAIDDLIKSGKVAAGSRTDMAKTGIGIAVRAGAPRPSIKSGDDLKKALLAAKSVGYSTGPSGVYLQGLFDRMGVGPAVKAKTKTVASGLTVGSIVVTGEAEIGFQQISELCHVEGIDYIGPLPPDVQHVTVFSCGIHTQAKEAAVAKDLVKFLTGPNAKPAIEKAGLEPV
jgi:molybdate transport system substrate-binding protein